MNRLWHYGTHGRVVGTFGDYDALADDDWLPHAGFPILDRLQRVLNHGVWHIVAFGFLLSAYRKLLARTGHRAGVAAPVNLLTFTFMTICSPRSVIESWQRQITF